MAFGEMLYTVLIRPLQLVFEFIYMMANEVIDNPGLSIIALSLAMNFLVLPLYRRADAMQEEERNMEQKLHAGVAHIKKTFKGDERMMILQTYYRQNDYKPTDVFKGSVSLFLEIPFFIAAYQFLSHLSILQGVSFGPIVDLSTPDGLINIGSFCINLLPIIMTLVNLISCVIFTKGYPLKTKIQLYSMAIFFFFFLYTSPAGLVFYWTLNNIFSLVKTIFYKLKNPKKVLRIMAAIVGVAVIVYGIGFSSFGNVRYKLIIVMLGIALVMPAIMNFINSKRSVVAEKEYYTNKKVFLTSALYLCAIIGLAIPSSVIVSSPQEFVDLSYFVNPTWYIVSATMLAVGLFLVWLNVFYELADAKFRRIFEIAMWIFAGVATIDYLFFGKDFGTLSTSLVYIWDFYFTSKVILINFGVIVVVAVVFYFAYRKLNKLIPQLLLVASIAFAVMAVGNIKSINESVAELEDSIVTEETEKAEFSLSKNGKNVIVFMLDRAMGEYIPYIMNEKPELKEVYSGFTYYANTVSFGGFTNFGTPTLYGGYEYTPVEINARDDVSLRDKQNEALKVMPVIFDENGYDVTVCDPTYAGYQWVPDLSIYDDYPNIDAYITAGMFTATDEQENKVSKIKRNFFCYSLMKTLPAGLQSMIYDDGFYWRAPNDTVAEGQNIVNMYESEGINNETIAAYKVLQNLPELTDIEEEGNTFLMISNDTTHEPMLFQEPEYEPAMHVNNYEYEMENASRYTLDGKNLSMVDSDQASSYQTNMASLIQIGNWINYLKENDVYDNTRIIIVSDHGRCLNHFEDMWLEDDGIEDIPLNNLEFYYPLLMVKDFGAESFTTSEEFMTNADVPTLAFEGLVESPVNPSTGKVISNDEKTAHDQYILASDKWQLSDNYANTFAEGIWYSVHADMRDVNNWKIENINSLTPFK